MAGLDIQRYKFLKKIKKKPLPTQSVTTDEKLKCDYFLKNHYIIIHEEKQSIVSKSGFISHKIVSSYYQITEEGKVAIYNFYISFMRWWIPLLISIAALGLSLFQSI